MAALVWAIGGGARMGGGFGGSHFGGAGGEFGRGIAGQHFAQARGHFGGNGHFRRGRRFVPGFGFGFYDDECSYGYPY